MRQFKGLSDFFRNATEDEKREIYLEVIDKAIIEQNETLDKAKRITGGQDEIDETTGTVA